MNKVILIITILILILKTETVFSKNFIFDVNNITVSSNIGDNYNKNNLLELAFKKGFQQFINKSLLSNDIKRLSNVELQQIKNLIFSYQIINEEVLDNKNFLTVNLKFDKEKFKNYLFIKNIPYAEISKISLILFPVLISNEKVYLYSENYFYKNWNNVKETNDENISYNLILEDIEDLSYIAKNKDKLEFIDVKKLISDYENKNYVFIIINKDQQKLNVFIKTFIENKDINKNMKLTFNPNDENNSYNNAIYLLKKEISQIIKSQNLISVNVPSFIDFNLKLKKNDDLYNLQNIFDNIDMIEKYSVLELNKDYVKIRVKYLGKIEKIKNKIISKGVKINIIDNEWRLKIG
jgi:hypothetical protein